MAKLLRGVNKRTETDLKEISSNIWQKVAKIDKNTERVNKRTEIDFKEISGNIWQKVAKIDKNTEGVNKRTETDFKEILSNIWQKVAKIDKNTEGVNKWSFTKKSRLYDDKKEKKYCLYDDKKIKKNKKRQQGTPHSCQPAAKAHTQSPTRRVCRSATVPCNQKKCRSSIKRKGIKEKK